jgi:Cysteine rich repeat
MIRPRHVPSALLVSVTLLITPAVLADTDPPRPCLADAKKLCPGVKPGHGAILICLEKKAEQVSDVCKESVQAKAQAIYDACKLDKDNFCPKVEPGEGRILQCLGQHEAQMSPECKAVWSKGKTSKAKAEAQAK